MNICTAQHSDIVSERVSHWQNRLISPEPNQRIAVAEWDNCFAGFICAIGSHDSRWGTYVEYLHVAPHFKRMGSGTRLIQDIAKWSFDSWPDIGMYLWVIEPNTPARRFYEALGADIVEHNTWAAPDGSNMPNLSVHGPFSTSFIIWKRPKCRRIRLTSSPILSTGVQHLE